MALVLGQQVPHLKEGLAHANAKSLGTALRATQQPSLLEGIG